MCVKLKIYDKSIWQIDAGINKDIVAKHFELLFSWLDSKKLLNEEGIELLELGAFSDISLHEGLLNNRGNAFIDSIYDKLLKDVPYGSEQIVEYLTKEFRAC